jgi:hypothetical protein
MKQSPSYSQEIPHILQNTNVHYRIHKSLPLVLILSRVYPIHSTHPISLRSIINQPTNSMKQSPSWEANTHSASQEIIHIL